MASDELIERAAIAMARTEDATSGVTVPWDEFTDESREEYRTLARTVLAVVEAERGWEYAIRAKEGIIAAGYDNIAVAEFDAAMATENPPGDLEVARRHPASDWEACE